MSMINWAELQLAIMNVLWLHGEATVHDVIANLPGEKTPAYTTVLTVLTNLTKQGLVSHEARTGTRMFSYRANVSREEIQAGITDELIDRLFDGLPASLIMHLLQTHAFEEAELRNIANQVCAPLPEDLTLTSP